MFFISSSARKILEAVTIAVVSALTISVGNKLIEKAFKEKKEQPETASTTSTKKKRPPQKENNQ